MIRMLILIKFLLIGLRVMDNNILILDKDIFAYKAINSAISDYSELAKISFTSEEGSYYLKFINCIYDVTLTIHEFENYLIGLMNGRSNK